MTSCACECSDVSRADLASHLGVGFFSANSDASCPIELRIDGETRGCSLPTRIAVDEAGSDVVCAWRGCG